MSIFTNSSNPATLKILISANFARKAVDIKIVDSKVRALDDPRHLPYLKTNEENSIFVPNSAVSFFVPSQESKTNEWLEWEATVLSPGLAQTLGGNVKHLKDSVTAALKKIEEALNHSLSLTSQELITAADIAVWSSLFPLTVDDNLAKEFLAENLNVSRWIKRLGEIKEFQSAVNLFKIESGVGAYQALLTGAKYLTPTENMSQSPATENVSVEELETAETFWNSTEKIPKLVSRPKIVLPGKGRNILITSALPYVNNVPHLGNIIGCVLSADVFARFCRICNYNTLYIGGTDEYGTATETKALEEGLSCRAICDKYYAIHKDIYDWFNISFDHFGRTSSPEQTEITQDMFQILNKNGFIFVEPVEQLHCEKCDRYLADRFVEGGCPHPGCKYEDARGDQCDGCGKLVNAVDLKNPRCKICRNTPKLKISKQFYIDLPKLEPLLLHWMKKSAPGWSSNAQVIARAWLKEGLKPRCITRDLKWGIPVPVDGFREKVFYVWFDAPFGYMSSTAAYTKDWELWWKPQKGVEVSLYQFMAKDNVPFHSIMFPAALLGTNRGYTTVSHIMATEYLNYEDGKFSKSRGVGVFGNDARDTGIPSDVWRFYLLYVRPESQDSSFSWSDLATKNNSELLNNLGNFVNRALVFAKNNFDNSVPEMEPIRDDFVLLALCARELKGYVASLEKAKLRDGIRHILSISRHGNQYMQTNQPWVLLKGSPEDKVRAGTVIGICCNIACLLALLLHPYMPETSDNLRKQLNAPVVSLDSSNMAVFKFLAAGHKIGEPAPLFTKLEQTHVEELKQKFAGRDQERNQANAEVPATNGIDVKYLEEEVTKQGLVVRKLKESGVDKAVWQPEVTKLLGLKTSLAAALGSPVEAKKNGKKGKK